MIIVIQIGDTGVGKTALLERFVKNEFHFDGQMTVGVDDGFKLVNIGRDKIKAQIMDTGTYIWTLKYLH